MKTLLIILLFSLISEAQIILNPRRAAIINPPVTGVTPLYTLDFEEGDLSDFTHIGANSTAHGDAAHTGSYGLRITSSSSDANYFTFSTGLDEVYVTFYIYVPSTTTFASGAYSYSTWIYTSNATTARSIIGGHPTGGDEGWRTWMMGTSDGTFADNATNWGYDEWHKIKLYFKKGATSYHTIWVDGNEALNGTAAHNETANGFSVCIYQPSATNYIYWDDFNVYDEDPD